MNGDTKPQRRRQHQGREVRESAVAGLLSLRRRGLLTAAHVEGVATGLGVTGRSVWRWLSSADKEGRLARKPRPHFELNDADVSDPCLPLRQRGRPPSRAPASRGGGAEPRHLAPGGSSPVVARSAARLSKGERARRDHDTYLTRKAGFRNECWEADHTELALRAQLPDGSLVRPWLTMFVDHSTRAIPGWAWPSTPLRPACSKRCARLSCWTRPVSLSEECHCACVTTGERSSLPRRWWRLPRPSTSTRGPYAPTRPT